MYAYIDGVVGIFGEILNISCQSVRYIREKCSHPLIGHVTTYHATSVKVIIHVQYNIDKKPSLPLNVTPTTPKRIIHVPTGNDDLSHCNRVSKCI